MHTVKCLFALCLSVLLSILILQTETATAASPDAESLYSLSAAALASGDTAGAILLLKKVPETDQAFYKALLLRGRLYYARGDKKAAIKDFQSTLRSDSAQVRIQAYVGLAETEFYLFGNKLQADRYLKKANAIDPDSRDVNYAKMLMELAAGYADGQRLSKIAWFKIAGDLGYRYVYRVWRDCILYQTH